MLSPFDLRFYDCCNHGANQLTLQDVSVTHVTQREKKLSLTVAIIVVGIGNPGYESLRELVKPCSSTQE